MIATATTPPACRVPASGSWSGIAQTTAIGRVTIAGLSGTATIDTDVTRGRYARRFDVPGMGSTSEVYDGTTIWAQDISGGVHPYDTPFARARAITSAYVTCLGTHVESGRNVTVIRVVPRGGVPAELTFDSHTHLLTKISTRPPLPGHDGTTRFSDYRTVDGNVLPFSIEVGTEQDATDGYVVNVTRYRFERTVRDGDFAKPVAPDNAKMLGGVSSTTVPMFLEGRQLIVWASIDGRSPMPFILDTGGHAILTTLAAKSLGLSAHGAGASGGSGSGTISTQYTHVASVRIGSAELLDQSFLVIPYPYSFYERGKRVPLAGILGLEFFERFATRLDYGDRTVTLTPLASYRHGAGGSSARLMFEDQEDMPVVNAAADGHPGLFGTDTGNAGILILFGDFLTRTGLLAQYTGGAATLGQGTGGSNTGHLETLKRFTIAGHDLRNLLANFTQMTSGSFASRTEAGNMGFSILSQFIPTFDYASQTLYLDPEKRATPFGINRTGLHFTKNEPGAFDVLLVDPGSVAATAGLVKGDRILAINGKSADNYSWADLTALVAKPAGTVLMLQVQRGGATRDVTLVLR
jgi:hypothetical protein